MADRQRPNVHGPRSQAGGGRGDSHRDRSAEPSGPADVVAGWDRDHWRAPRDFGEQAAAGGGRPARAERPVSGPIGTPEPRRYNYGLEGPARDLHDNDQLVGGRAYSGLGREAQPQRRGPRGYRRSDDRIREDICEALMATTHLDASDVTVDVSEGIVHLQGIVPERRMKHAIEDVTAAVSGVVDVDNRIRVVRGIPGAPGRHDDSRDGRE